MENLGERYAYMIANASKVCGRSREILEYIFEDIYIGDDKEISKFISWLVDNECSIKETSLEDYFKEFKEQ